MRSVTCLPPPNAIKSFEAAGHHLNIRLAAKDALLPRNSVLDISEIAYLGPGLGAQGMFREELYAVCHSSPRARNAAKGC